MGKAGGKGVGRAFGWAAGAQSKLSGSLTAKSSSAGASTPLGPERWRLEVDGGDELPRLRSVPTTVTLLWSERAQPAWLQIFSSPPTESSTVT